MALELRINKDLGHLNATAYAFASLAGVVHSALDNREFLSVFDTMLLPLCEVFKGLCDTLDPPCNLQRQEEFSARFDDVQTQYQKIYLAAASQPRKHAESCHERYLELSSFPLIHTSYPLLKQTFATLYTLMDKWITNDAWLVMSADGVFKSVNRWLLELSHLKKQDVEDAWLVYRFGVLGFRANLTELKKSCRSLELLSLSGDRVAEGASA